MGDHKREFQFRLIPLVLFFMLIASGANAAKGDVPPFELGLAGGGSLNGSGSVQGLLLAAYQTPFYPNYLFRVEPTVEYMNAKGDVLYDTGFSLAIRKLVPYKFVTPFVDLGAGLNYISRNHFAGRELGGNFMFDLMLGGGFYLTRNINISYRYRHLSNAGIFSINEGIDSYYVLLGIGI
ncbi:MAG: acyloxyacyl hydrolase [Nitrospiraceae bacterium]|nr:acyloxyacyl hydrolase [Nitrospiraceae bacterium]